MTRYSLQFARWGLLVTAVVLATTLMVTGITTYLGARVTAESVMRNLAHDQLFELRPALNREMGSVNDVLASRQESGLRYLGLWDQSRPLVEAGTSASAVSADELAFRAPTLPASELMIIRPVARDRLRVVAALVPPRPPSAGSDRMSGWRERPDVTGTDAVRIVFELDPILATSITSRAVFTLVTESVTGVVLIVVAAVFWRYSRRVEADARHVERDRHLRMLGEMSALLGHELRNPLASLKGHAQLLVERLPDGHPGRRGAATIVREAVRLEDLATEVLDFVRTGALDIADVDPVQVAQSALEASGGDGVAIEAAGGLPRWPMDGARIQQVLVNLLKNARDASTAEIDISLVVALAAGSLLYEVRDRGVGLQPGDEERAFQPFFTRRASGTGLGLPLARRIVEGHGGTIQAEKREGGGAVFRITLPRVPASRGSDAAAEER